MFCTNCGVALYEGAAFCSACGRPVIPGEVHETLRKVAYAGFWRRLLALAIDSLVLTIPSFLVVMFAVMFLGLKPEDTPADLTTMPPMRVFLPMEAMFVTVHWLYFALMESSKWQGTLGKRAIGVGVTDLNGKRLSFGHASARFFGKLLSGALFMVGYAMAAFTEKKQALHDILAKCLVVRMP